MPTMSKAGCGWCCLFWFKQRTAYEVRISDWSSDVCSSDLLRRGSPSLAVSYRLDAEDVGRSTLRPNGLSYIPRGDRENHSFQLSSGMSWTRWQISGAAGWTFDRKGKTDGPTANVSATGQIGRAHV